MEKNDLEKYLKQLEELDKELGGDKDPDNLLDELNKVLNGLSTDLELDVIKKNHSVTLKFINKSNNPDPVFAHEGDSGFDLRAHLENNDECYIEPGKFAAVPTGLYVEVQKGLEIQVRPRSGLAIKQGITIVNSPGTIDSHYRGQIIIIIGNLGDNTFVIKNGDRIAQGVVCPVYGEGNLKFEKVEKLSETIRNDNGFGSTGES